jgi:hypothetical protein
LDGPRHAPAEERLRALLRDGEDRVREAAVRRLGRAPASGVATTLLATALDDPSSAVRHQALRSLATLDPAAAAGPAIEALATSDRLSRGAAFEALRGIDLDTHLPALGRLSDAARDEALRDRALADSVRPNGEAADLLRAALLDRGRRHAVVSILAASAATDRRDDVLDVVESLESDDPGQVANALEILESGPHGRLVRSLASLWERSGEPTELRDGWLEEVLHDHDPTIRAFAELVRTPPLGSDQEGGPMAGTPTSMSAAERVLVLRRIPLLAGLSPADLRNVAEIAEERSFGDGAVIATQGEIGDELHIVLDGTIAVVRGEGATEATVARRGEGQVVGEMSILTHDPRIASLVAEGDVRTLRIGHREFESMLRERPDVALAVMRVLAERLAALTSELEGGRRDG